MNKKSFNVFFQLIISSFFRWWWAAITVFVSIAPWLFFPKEGILITPLNLSLLIFFGSALIFLCLSIFHQGWQIYQKHFTFLQFVKFLKSDIYGDEYLILLEGDIDIVSGTLVELKRFDNEVEVSMALVEIKEKNSKGQYQAKPIWISSGHFRDLKMGKIEYSDIKSETLVKLSTLQKARENIINIK